MQYRANNFQMPPVVMNLLIVNAICYLATSITPRPFAEHFTDLFALQYFESTYFRIWQPFTYMFLHGNLSHIFFNMFALWMFGRSLEYEMGSKRFLTYYLVTGVGAALLQMGVNYFEFAQYAPEVKAHIHSATVGASGAVYGLLLAFGMFYPNSIIMLLFPPIPMKAKYFVIIFGLVELFLGFTGRQSGVAHFAHIGGMLWGWLLLLWWKKQHKIFY